MFHLLDIAHPLSFPLEADYELMMQLLAALIPTILIELGVLWLLKEQQIPLWFMPAATRLYMVTHWIPR